MLSLLLPLLRGHGSPHPARLLPLACVLVALGSLAGSLPGMALAADGVVAHAEDQLFTVRTLSQARTAAGDERLVVVYLTEDGNDDCAFMEAEAWTHPDVRAWVDEHATTQRGRQFSVMHFVGNSVNIDAAKLQLVMRITDAIQNGVLQPAQRDTANARGRDRDRSPGQA